MSNFSTYKNRVQQVIANESSVFYTDEKMIAEINSVYADLVNSHDIPALLKKATVNVVDGKALMPDDMHRIVKLYQIENNNITKDFVYVTQTDFDVLPDSGSAFMTQDYDTADNTLKYFFKPVETYDLVLRYIKKPQYIESVNGANDLDSIFDNYIVHMTAANLFQQSGRYDESQLYMQRATKYLKDALDIVLYPGGRKQQMRLRSYYEFNKMF